MKGPIITSFVDDLNIFALPGSGIISRIKSELTTAFEMVDIGPLAFYVGLKVIRDREKRTIKLSQPGYIERLLDCHGMLKAKTAKVPMRDTILLPSNIPVSESENVKYIAKVSSIMYAMVETRIDIAFTISMVSRFAKNPSSEHFNAINQILQYFARSPERGITFGGEKELKLIGYSNFDWAGDHVDRKSTSGFIFMLNGGPISYASKKQAIVALSSTEAEYVALNLAVREATWLRLLLTELGLLMPNDQFTEIHIDKDNKCAEAILFPNSNLYPERISDQNLVTTSSQNNSIDLKGDNQSSIALANNPVLYTQTKHINIQYHYIRDEVTSRRINLVYTLTEKMLADGLTKPLSHVKFFNFIKKLMME